MVSYHLKRSCNEYKTKATTKITELSKEGEKWNYKKYLSNTKADRKRGRKEKKNRWGKEQNERLKPNYINDHIKRLMVINKYINN